ncbi:MAG: PIG-L family deacetylase [Dehalococcoidia bacterium]|nr:PIG-L family deacetylase [Dehalococcoidia bacterium]
MPTLLVITPHPDDEAYAFGGTIALAAAAGWRCLVHCATRGERGKVHDGGDPAEVGAARERELAAACAVLGAEPPVTWGLADGALREVAAPPAALVRALQDTGADVVLSLGADGAYGHPDHLAVYRWVVAAWRALPAKQRPALLLASFPRGLFLPQYEKCIGMMGDPPSPPPADIGDAGCDLEVDIRAVAARKRAAIAAHRSQLPGGDPEALFPPGIVGALMEREQYRAADVVSRDRARGLFADWIRATPRDS